MDEMTRNKPGATHESVLPPGETPCIWMLAGVLTCWLCDRGLACESCPLDAALRHDSERPVAPRESPRLSSPDVETQRVPPPYDEDRSFAVGTPLEDLLTAALSELEEGYLYARDHMWALPGREGLVRIGLDAFAARVVGRLRCVVLAPVGTRLHKGHPCAWLDLPGGTLTLLSPVSGQVLHSNEGLARRADLEIREPFGREWLLELQPFRWRTESRALLRARDFAPLVREDFAAWQAELRLAAQGSPSTLGQTLADGGHHVRSLAELLGTRGVQRLASRFLSPRSGMKPKDKRSR